MEKHLEKLEAVIAEKDLEIKALKQQLISSNSPLMTIFVNLSHEVRTPLNGIVGFSELLANNDFTPEELKLYSGVIAESSTILMSLLTDVLDIVKIESDRFHVYSALFDLNDLLFQIYNEYNSIAENKNLQLYLDNFISEQFMVSSDPEIVKRILKKLLDNAMKFTKEGWVDLKYEEDNGKIIFTVEDTGIGINKELRNNLFDRFISEEVSKSRHIGGSGLDLSLCNSLVRLLGGEIWLKDKMENGTIFQFSFRNDFQKT